MPFREIILTKKLFVIKMGKMNKYYEELTGRVKPTCTKAHLKALQRIIDNNTIYCGICEEPIDENYFGKSIIINKNQTSYMKKWFHTKCAELKQYPVMNNNNDDMELRL